jgi:RNA methyltransferase, TrmH family
MLSKARIKFIKSLQLKKYRKQEQSFVVEGAKSVLELLRSDFQIEQLLITQDFREKQEDAMRSFRGETLEVKPSELAGMGEYSSNDAALAIVRMKPNQAPVSTHNGFFLMLDDIRDPGNMGTMIRTADWYGIKNIIASEETAEVYNSKVIQASMGSFIRVNIFYTDLSAFLTQNALPVFGTFLDGANVHAINFGSTGIIVIGNEANGISKEVEQFVTTRITIPRFGHAESLNAAIATAVICDNIRRREG